MRDTDIIKILASVDHGISKSEQRAFFRAKDHPNHKPGNDQVPPDFLMDLIIRVRGPGKRLIQRA